MLSLVPAITFREFYGEENLYLGSFTDQILASVIIFKLLDMQVDCNYISRPDNLKN